MPSPTNIFSSVARPDCSEIFTCKNNCGITTLQERSMKFYEVLKGENAHSQSTKNIVVNTGQTTALSYLSLMESSMTDIIPFSWVVSLVSPILITVINRGEKK